MTPTDSGRKSFNATFSFGSSITTTPSLNSSKANSSFISTSSGNYQHQSPRKQTPRKPIVDKQSVNNYQKIRVNSIPLLRRTFSKYAWTFHTLIIHIWYMNFFMHKFKCNCKMISYYQIGPRGRKAQYFMSKYQSLIHFPDSNCRPDGPKMNKYEFFGNHAELGTILFKTASRVVPPPSKKFYHAYR